MATIPCDFALPRFCPNCGPNEPCKMRNREPREQTRNGVPFRKQRRIDVPNRLYGATITPEGDAI